MGRHTNKPKATSRQFAILEFQRVLTDLRTARTAFRTLCADTISEGRKVAKLLDEHGAYWWAYYELTFAEHLAILVCLFGWKEKIIEIARRPDATGAFLEFARQRSDDEPDPSSLSKEQQAAFLNLFLGVPYSIEAIAHYGLSMNELLAKAARGDKGSLIKAASIDRAVLGTPSAAHIISLAQLRREKGFFQSLLKRMKNPHAARKQYIELRFMHRIFKETNTLTGLSPDELLALAGDKLKLYPTNSGDPVKGLRELFREWTRETTS